VFLGRSTCLQASAPRSLTNFSASCVCKLRRLILLQTPAPHAYIRRMLYVVRRTHLGGRKKRLQKRYLQQVLRKCRHSKFHAEKLDVAYIVRCTSYVVRRTLYVARCMSYVCLLWHRCTYAGTQVRRYIGTKVHRYVGT